jgi:hypothetical protein
MMATSWRRGHLLGAVILIALVACGSTRGSRSPTPVEASIRIIDPGAEPRQRLRYELVRNAPEHLELALKTTIVTTMTNTVLETGSTRNETPTVRVRIRVEVADLTPTGEARITFAILEATLLDDVVLDPAVRRKLETELDAMAGLRGSWRMSSRGIVSGFEAPAASSAVKHRLDTMSQIHHGVVLPDAEIGIGAKWEVSERYSSAGVSWNRKATYTLSKLVDSTAEIEVEVVQSAPRQALRVEPTATTTLTSASAKGFGSLWLPLRGLVATGTSRMSAEMSFLIVARRLRITSAMLFASELSTKPSESTRSKP